MERVDRNVAGSASYSHTDCGGREAVRACSSSETQSEDSREWFVQRVGKAGKRTRGDAASGAGAVRPDCEHARLHEHAAREDGSDMNPYAIVGSGVGTEEAASLCARLNAWHDAML